MLVSIVIPCRNEEKHILKCLENIEKSDYPLKNIEVLVSDGLSSDNTISLINNYAATSELTINILNNIQQTTPQAFNLGIKHSNGEIIIIVGARHLISTNYISYAINQLYKNPHVACVGGKVINKYENKTSEIIATAMASSFGVGGGNFRIQSKETFVDTVGTPVYRKSIFNEIGLFDTELIRNQDDEFNLRVLKAGYKILFTPAISIEYYVRASFPNLWKQYYQYGYWKVYVNKKHKTISTYRQLAPALLVAGIFIGFILAFLNKYFLYFYLAVLGSYVGFAIINALKSPINNKLSLIKAYLYLHLSYGMGYIEGIFRFLILNKRPVRNTLSR